MSTAVPTPTATEPPSPATSASLTRDAWRRLRRNRLALGATCFLALLCIVCSCGPLFSTHDYRGDGRFLAANQPPSMAHWLGTDGQGRDLLVRLLHGGRVSLAVGICATLVSLTIGVTWGAIAGFVGGRLDALMMRMVEITYSLPFVVLVILLLVFTDALAKEHELGATWNMLMVFCAIGAVSWLTMARIVRGQVMVLRQQEFVQAALILGYSRSRILFRHIIPNAMGPVIVYATLTVPAVMLLEAFLSFLGLGVQPPMTSWGALIKEGADRMEEYPWLLLGPGILFSLTLFSLNFLGDGLRDAFDVRSARD